MKAKTIMVQGTTSGAGKSMITTALCLIFAKQGLRVAPFKAWNMSQNYYAGQAGLKIGNTQGLQARLLGLPVCGEMNPVYLRALPGNKTELYLKGRHFTDEVKGDFKELVWPIIKESLFWLGENYDLIVMEGSGSPVELNIKEQEVANMRVASLVDAPVLLVADVAKGGALAGIIGTIDLLTPQEKNLVIGSVLNRFRGDLDIMESGCEVIEEITKRPVLGVIPEIENLNLSAEHFVTQVENNLDLAYINKILELEGGTRWGKA